MKRIRWSRTVVRRVSRTGLTIALLPILMPMALVPWEESAAAVPPAAALAPALPATVVKPPPDTTPPLISTVAAGAIGPTQATINWTTSEPATTQVSYGATSAYGTDTALNAAPTTSHSQVLGGLTASTTYHYRVR